MLKLLLEIVAVIWVGSGLFVAVLFIYEEWKAKSSERLAKVDRSSDAMQAIADAKSVRRVKSGWSYPTDSATSASTNV